ncbi:MULTISPECIES: starch-binding protein [unclassified Ruminococcus]|uniref:DUF7601 domain-containing protein n=1 Tax=unclassified Ruminococcus TaxID=2608920 RepID=UPI00210C26C5
MTKKAKTHGFLGRLSAFLMAAILLLSVFVPMSISTVEVGAAASATVSGGEKFTIHLDSSAASYWRDPMQVRFVDSTGATKATVSVSAPASGGSVVVTAPAEAAGATGIVVENLDSTKTAIKTEIDQKVAAAPAGKTLVLYDNTSSNWGQVNYYVWNNTSSGTDKEANWPGNKITTTLSGNSKIYYTYVDAGRYPNIIFSNNGASQTDDLQTPTGASNLYNSAVSKWTEYTAVVNSASLSVANRAADGKNHLYLTGEKTAKWSKYGDTIELTTIYFKPTANWTNAYVTYDGDDPYRTTVRMTKYENGDADIPLIFTAQVPVGAKLTFTDAQTNPSYSVSNVIYDGDTTHCAYIQADRQWDTLEKALRKSSTNVDYTVGTNNFATATASGGGDKVIGVKATYFDYLSNNEISSGWRKNLQSFNYDASYRSQLSKFNDLINEQAKANTAWRYPLYFGDDFDSSYYINGYYNSLKDSRTITEQLFYAANNSGGLTGDWDKGTDDERSRSVLGLVDSQLSSGNLTVGGGALNAPWFNNDLLKPNDSGGGSEPATVQIVWGKKQSGGNWCYKIAIPKAAAACKYNKNNNNWSNEINLSSVGDGTVYKTKGGTFNNTSSYPEFSDGSKGGFTRDSNYYYLVIEDDDNWTAGDGVYVHYWNNDNPSVNTTSPGIKLVDGITSTGGATTAETQYAKIVDSYFPFVANTDETTGVTTYSFNSSNPTDGQQSWDNVYFDWDSAGSPTKINYSSDASKAIQNQNTGNKKYGIFPFNTANGYGGYNETGRDYGYGIKMEMQFTLPMNGVYGDGSGGVSGPTQITWKDGKYYKIAIPKDNTDFQINPGNNTSEHNFTLSDIQGKIYKTDGTNYTATNQTSLGNPGSYSDDNYYYVVIDNSNSWSKICVYYWGGTGNSWPGTEVTGDIKYADSATQTSNNHAMFNYSGDDDLWVFVDGQLVLDLGGAHTPTTGSIDFGYGTNQVRSTANKAYYELNTGSGKNTDVAKNGASVEKTFNINNTDPSRKHTMTVFYMERGLNDSNLSVSYSIQPIENELFVDKVIQVPQINSGLETAVEDALANAEYGFTLNHAGSAYGNKTYALTKADKTKETKTTTSSGGFALKQNERAYFGKELKYNDSISVSEGTPGLFAYDTYLTVVDNKTDNKLVERTKAASKTFNLVNLVNGTGDENEGASVSVDYENILKTANLTLDKNLLTEQGTESENKVPFEFTVELDLDGDGDKYSYQTYDLEYRVPAGTFTAQGGKLSIRPDQTATIMNIPVGAKYRISETAKAGYELNSITGATSISGSAAIGTISNSGSGVTFTNKEKPASSGLRAQKTLDGQLYSGSDFSFNAQLVDVRNIDGGTKTQTELNALKEEKAYNNSKSVVAEDGYVTFADFSVLPSDQYVAKYIFKITEDPTASESPYNYDSTAYYAVIEVIAGSVKAPVYYTNSACTTLVGVDGKTAPTFENFTKGVDVQFTKVDQNGVGIDGVQFKIYTDEACTAENQYKTNGVGAAIGDNGTVTSAGGGIVKVEKMAYSTTAATTYYFVETKTVNGKQLLANPVVVTIATDGTYTVSYNGVTLTDKKVVNVDQPDLPNAGAVGVTMLYVFGSIAVIGAGTAYVLYRRKSNLIALAKQMLHRR